MKITPDSAEVGVLISGDECKLDNVKTVDGADCYQITGTGTILNNCLGGFPAAGSHGFNILGAQTGLYGCGTVGDTTTCGYYISSSDTGILSDCTSVGHQTSGYYIDTGSVHWIIVDCSTGTGDGKWRDVDNLNV